MKTVKIYFVSGGYFQIVLSAANAQSLVLSPMLAYYGGAGPTYQQLHIAATASTPETYVNWDLVERVDVV